MGGENAGMIGALVTLSLGCTISAAVSYSDRLASIFKSIGIDIYGSIYDDGFVEKLKQADLLLSIHGREVVPAKLLGYPTKGGVNIHPYLYAYRGGDPVARALKDGNFKASVGAHVMEEKIDQGIVIDEEFLDVTEAKSVEEIYNRLYPVYCEVITRVLKKVRDEARKATKS